jgi:putative helicase MOV10L1
MRFNEKFHEEFRGGTFKVAFQMSRYLIFKFFQEIILIFIIYVLRMLYRRCHHAIDLADNFLDQVLFPNKVLIKKPFKQIPLESIKWFNPTLNLQQKLAVVGALRGECRPTPYIIFGPPGTGKTVTIVESILQVFTKIPQSRIIACTSANSSADLIANKLLESGQITERDIIRISAFHR